DGLERRGGGATRWPNRPGARHRVDPARARMSPGGGRSRSALSGTRDPAAPSRSAEAVRHRQRGGTAVTHITSAPLPILQASSRTPRIRLIFCMRHRLKYVGQNNQGRTPMEQSLEQRIRERAYTLWLEHGRADGNAEQHWLVAEREVLARMTAQVPAPEPTAAGPKPNKRRATSTTPKPRARASAQ